MSSLSTPGSEAAMVLGMASTAMPFAGSPQAEAERWLRIMRLHGQVGTVLQALGVSEAPLEDLHRGAEGEPSERSQAGPENVVAAVTENALQLAGDRGSHTLATSDVLLGVMHLYGADFDRVLRVHGTDRDEVLERLGVTPSGAVVD